MTTPSTDPREHYRNVEAERAAERVALGRRSRLVSHLRLALFTLAISAIVASEIAPQPLRAAALVVALATLGGFVAAVAWHGRVRRAEARARARSRLAAEGLARLQRRWSAVPAWSVRVPAEHPYAADLNILGHASISSLLGPVSTPGGRAVLGRWLLDPAGREETLERQAAVRELARDAALRDELAARGRLAGDIGAARVERFLGWATREPWLLRRPRLLWAARLLPLATIGLAALQIAGVVGANLWLAGVAANLLLTLRHAGALGRTRRDAAPVDELDPYADLLRLLEAASFDAPRLRRLRAALGVDSGAPASAAIARLERILHLADLRLSFVHFAVHLVTLWDFHVVARLERWAREEGGRARGWLEALGEAEALAALATLAFDQPEWVFPEIAPEEEPACFQATSLGHPLLAPGTRVANDVSVGPSGTLLLVTGSNMSGKSTLLRAIGANAVLAACGAPACAASLRLTTLRPFTSMRIRDSLEEGLSFFMAEVRRLRQVVEAAAEPRGAPVLYLLDEILQGTNVEEHREGARWVLERLLATRAIGAVATHDLAIANRPPLREAARVVHFREAVVEEADGPAMRFDYALRPGPATSHNALRLMRLAGLGPPGE